MSPPRPISVHRPSGWLYAVFFLPVLFGPVLYLVLLLSDEPPHVPYPGQEAVAGLLIVLAWAGFFYVLWRVRQHRVELFPDGIASSHRDKTVNLEPRLYDVYSLLNKVLDRLDPVLTARCFEQLRAGETLTFGPKVSLSSRLLRAGDHQYLPSHISESRAIDGCLRIRVEGRWMWLGAVPNAYTLRALLGRLRHL